MGFATCLSTPFSPPKLNTAEQRMQEQMRVGGNFINKKILDVSVVSSLLV